EVYLGVRADGQLRLSQTRQGPCVAGEVRSAPWIRMEMRKHTIRGSVRHPWEWTPDAARSPRRATPCRAGSGARPCRFLPPASARLQESEEWQRPSALRTR